MKEILSYRLNDFVMIHPDVLQEMYSRYQSQIFSMSLFFILFNLYSVYGINKNNFLFTRLYISLSWIFVSLYFFLQYFNELHTMGPYFLALFIIEAFLLFWWTRGKEFNLKSIGGSLLGIGYFVPFSYFLNKSQGHFLWFPLGIDSLCIVTIGLIFMGPKNKKEILVLLIPLLWLFYSFFI